MFKKQFIIPLLALLCVIALVIPGQIKQDQTYHNFADQRKLWRIPNFLNVITNLPFAIVAAVGLKRTKKIYQGEQILKPSIRLSHPIKGRIPEAKNRAR